MDVVNFKVGDIIVADPIHGIIESIKADEKLIYIYWNDGYIRCIDCRSLSVFLQRDWKYYEI